MIVVTGAAGFIGSCMVRQLNDAGHLDIIVVDEFSHAEKNWNLEGKNYTKKVAREDFPVWLEQMHDQVAVVFHLGARTDTTEKDTAIFDELNLNYSILVWNTCTKFQIPLLYASSAATYGLGELGYDDNHALVNDLKPLNPYGVSKNDFDKWVLQQSTTPPFWAGLKFFNVYGPNEHHKGRMASVIMHTARQIKATGGMKLFKSHNPDFKDGEQKRDFIYVKDVVNVLYWLWQNRPLSAIYNLGTGQARTFVDLVTCTFESMDLKPTISFIDTPEDIRETYQYFTEANMNKLLAAGYNQPFYSLESGIDDYVKQYLHHESIW